jgi:hypothetical protein
MSKAFEQAGISADGITKSKAYLAKVREKMITGVK